MLLAVHILRQEICHENAGRKLERDFARTEQTFHVPFVIWRQGCLSQRYVVSLNVKIRRIWLLGCEWRERLF